MPKPEIGTDDWFKAQKKETIRFARDFDSVTAAFASVSRLAKEVDSSDYEICSSLTTSFVINYARPFISKLPHPIRYLRENPSFDPEIHRHIIYDLRHKLIAHADDEYSPGVLRLKIAAVGLDLGSGTEEISIPIAARVRVAALYSVYDRALLENFVTHIGAASHELGKAMRKKLFEYLRAAQSFPDAIQKMRQVDTSEPLEFSSEKEAKFSIPNMATNLPSRVPELMKGKDGYVYREMQVLQLTDSVKISDENDNELVVIEKQAKP